MNIHHSFQLCVIVAVLVTLSQAYSGEVPQTSGLFRRIFSGYEKRAITRFDRMGRYYGKRSSPDIGKRFLGNDRPLYTVDELQRLASQFPVFARMMIQVYLDHNGDGLIDEGELSDLRARIVDV